MITQKHGTLCHIRDYYNGFNNGYYYGVNLFDNEDLDEPLHLHWFKTKIERQNFIKEENIIIVKDKA